MRLKFKQPYQSITSLPETEITDFAIITGLNGSGKTHLLNAINLGHITIQEIEPSEILFYNYNDFSIYNGDPSQDAQMQYKHTTFSDKSVQLNQKLNNERSNALNSFQIDYSFDGQELNEHSFLYFPNFIELTNWTEADYSIFNNYNEFQNLHNQNERLNNLFDQIGHVQINDIRAFIQVIRSLWYKSVAMEIIRSYGYSKSQFSFDDKDFENILLGFSKAEDKYKYLELLQQEFNSQTSQALINFLYHIIGMPSLAENLNLEILLEIKRTINILFIELEKHFNAHMSIQSLNIIRAINDGDILKPVSSDSGFLNLYDIKLAEKQYQLQKKYNEYAEFESFKGRQTHYLNDDEFIRQNGHSPVAVLNSVLNNYDCNGYEFKHTDLHIDLTNGINTQEIDVYLYNKAGNYQTTLDSLSSGERTLLALAFTVYKLRKRRVIAKLFLMDEIDSALHPSMSKRLLQALYDLFHKEMGINIILSTHSPSTIAFAPDNSTYVMRRECDPRLLAVSKDVALNELTAGVPSFSINYENRRQVFVESKYDAEYYEALYVIMKDQLNHEISLNFISSGDAEVDKNGNGKSNCNQVIKITSILRKAGNKFIWGIVDWDLVNDTIHDGVKVLGHNQRYSIESYLLDPLLIGILLWRETYVDGAFFGLSNDTKYYEVTRFDASKLQLIVDKVIEKLKVQVTNDDKDPQWYCTISSMKLSIPQWFTKVQGHSLEGYYLKAFPKLNDVRRNKEWLLKETVIKKVIADFHTLAPIELLEILKQVQEI